MEMLAESDILIQRYSAANWTQIRGRAPFIVTGPNFMRWTLPLSLDKYREYRFLPELEQILKTLDGGEIDLARESIAEFLLREGICKAIWPVNVRSVISEPERWTSSITQLSIEIPGLNPVSTWTIELLSGLNNESYYRHYLLESKIVLETLIPPTEDV